MYTNAAADLTATFRENSAEGSGTKLEGVYGIDTSVRQTDGTAEVIAERNAATVTKANAVERIHGAYINYRRDPSATAAGGAGWGGGSGLIGVSGSRSNETGAGTYMVSDAAWKGKSSRSRGAIFMAVWMGGGWRPSENTGRRRL